MDWNKISQDLLEKVKVMRADDNGWKVAKKTKDVTCSRKQSTEWKGFIFKTEGEIDCDPETVFYFINPFVPDPPRNRWDATIKERKILETISPTMAIVKTVSHSALAGLISHRVFTDLIVVDITEDYLSSNAESVEYASSPENESSGVRGINHPSAIVCHRVPDNKSKTCLTYFIQTDLGGMLPQSLVDQALPSSQIDFFARIKNALKEAGH